MDPKQLRTLLTIVELESFTRASRKLALSQSAISQHVGGLEKTVGVQLLLRSGSGARPTRAGLLLAQYARQILGKMDEAQRLLADLDGVGTGSLRIGAGGAACHYLLPNLLKEFHEQHPRVEFQVFSGHTQRTIDRLHAGEIDIGVLTLPVAETKLRLLPIGFDELKAVVAPDHPWAERNSVHGSDFAEQRLLIYERRSQTFALIERTLLEHGVFPRIAVELDHLEAAIAIARVGLGVTIVPTWTVAAECAARTVCALPIGKRGLTRSWGIGLPDHPQRSHAVKAFVRLCEERLPEALAPPER